MAVHVGRHTGGTGSGGGGTPTCGGRLGRSIKRELAIDERSCVTAVRLSAPVLALPPTPLAELLAACGVALMAVLAATGSAPLDRADGSTCHQGAIKGMRAYTCKQSRMRAGPVHPPPLGFDWGGSDGSTCAGGVG